MIHLGRVVVRNNCPRTGRREMCLFPPALLWVRCFLRRHCAALAFTRRIIAEGLVPCTQWLPIFQPATSTWRFVVRVTGCSRGFHAAAIDGASACDMAQRTRGVLRHVLQEGASLNSLLPRLRAQMTSTAPTAVYRQEENASIYRVHQTT